MLLGRTALVLSLCSAVCACAIGPQTGKAFNTAAAGSIRLGDTKEKVLAAVGEPNAKRTVAGVDTWTYAYVAGQEEIKPSFFILMAGLFVPTTTDMTVKTNQFEVVFEGDKVADCYYAEWDGTGQSAASPKSPDTHEHAAEMMRNCKGDNSSSVLKTR